jgi:signal peptidase II
MTNNTQEQAGLSHMVHAGIVLLLVLLDRISKVLCDTLLPYAQAQTVFPGFDLLLVYNRGAAFSFLNDAGGWQRWLLATISAVVSVVIGVWLWRLPRQQVLLGIALSLVLAGALGNLYDRIVQGYVIDFISVYYRDWRFATFNVADAAISAGAVLLALDVFVGKDTK